MLPLPLVAGLAVRLLLIAAFFVVANLFRQLAGAVGDFALVFGEFALLGAAFGSALDAFLQPQDPFHFLDVLADPVLFAFQAIRAVFAQQQLQQRLDVLLGFALQSQQALAFRFVLGLELLQRRDALVQLDARQVLFGQLQGLHQQRRAARSLTASMRAMSSSSFSSLEYLSAMAPC